jgi:hypothetical protein
MGTGGGNIGVGQAPVPGEQGFPTGGGPQPQQGQPQQGGGPQPQQGQPQQGGGQGIPPQLMALLQAGGQ